jgi:hypothetical protein
MPKQTLPLVPVDWRELPPGATPVATLQHNLDPRTGHSLYTFTPAAHWATPVYYAHDKRTICAWLVDHHMRLPRMINNTHEEWHERIFLSTRKRPPISEPTPPTQLSLL